MALPLASRWYPAERQGLVMGIAAAGNSGTVIANLSAPRLANLLGWHNVLGLAMIPLAVVLVAFLLLARDRKASAPRSSVGVYGQILRRQDLWWFCLLYGVTFGGYVGLSSFLPDPGRGRLSRGPGRAYGQRPPYRRRLPGGPTGRDKASVAPAGRHRHVVLPGVQLAGASRHDGLSAAALGALAMLRILVALGEGWATSWRKTDRPSRAMV